MTSRRPLPPIRLRAGAVLAGTLLVCGVLACSGGSEPRTAEQVGEGTHTLPTADVGGDLPAPTPPPSRPPEAEEDEARGESQRSRDRDDTVIVIEEAPSGGRQSLAEAARRAREEREKAPRPKVVITDDNLSEYASGDVSIITPGKAEDGEGTEDGTAIADPRTEEYWRQGARELRLKLRRAWEESRELDEQAAGLRIRFYAEDDPYVRDSEIKPAWDRALERRRQAELEVRAYRRELDQFLEDGRRAGALPGWLREGIEHEPDLEGFDQGGEEAVDGFDRHRPVDPDATDPQDAGKGGGEGGR